MEIKSENFILDPTKYSANQEIFLAITKRKVTVKILVNSKATHKNLMKYHLQKLVQVNPKRVQVKVYSVSKIQSGN